MEAGKLKVRMWPSTLAQLIGIVGVGLWFLSFYLILSSPKTPDDKHTLPVNNHGTKHYLTPMTSALPYVAFPMIAGSICFQWWRVLSITNKTGLTQREVLKQYRTFGTVEFERKGIT